MRLALIDGDVLLYMNGFASDAAAKAEYRRNHNGSDEGFDIQEHHEPVEHCLHGLNETIKSIQTITDARSKVIYLSHPVNYREQFYPPYKRNRDVLHKPFWYDTIRNFLLDRHDALYSEQGDEADDALGIAQTAAMKEGVDSVICSIDKDLDMIPGLHYNFSKNRKENGVYLMEDPEAIRKFYAQMLTGDTSDNIPGMYQKLGIKATAKWFYPLEGFSDPEKMLQYVLKVFNNDREHVNMVGKLLWIKREQGGWWEL